MKISFTQTYSVQRREHIKYQMQDKALVDFKNTFDLNIYAFHNCGGKKINYFRGLNKLKNLHILIYDDYYNYSDTFKESIKFMKSLNPSSLFFSQDDTFSYNIYDYSLLHNFVKDHFIAFNYRWANFTDDGIIDGPFHNYKSSDFNKYGHWAMDDSPYYMDFKFIDDIYDEGYFSTFNIWNGERYLDDKFSKIDFIKSVLPESGFKNINFYGPTSRGTGTEWVITSRNAENFIKQKFETTIV